MPAWWRHHRRCEHRHAYLYRWPTVQNASADATYTALYEVVTYEITFINVDDTQEVQTVNAGSGGDTTGRCGHATRTFTSWPTVAPCRMPMRLISALYDEVPTYTITFVNADHSISTELVNPGEVAVPPTGVNSQNKTFIAWPRPLRLKTRPIMPDITI